jgi:hypothetical protein
MIYIVRSIDATKVPFFALTSPKVIHGLANNSLAVLNLGYIGRNHKNIRGAVLARSISNFLE